MSSYKIREYTFNSNELSVFDQFAIVRRIAPVVALTKETSAKILLAFSPIKHEDAEFIVDACLGVTTIMQAGIAAKLGTLRAPMFKDLKLMDYYDIADVVVRESLGSFFPEMLSMNEPPAPKAA